MNIVGFLDRFIPEEVHRDYSNQSRARIIVASSMLLLALMLFLVIPNAVSRAATGMMIFYVVVSFMFISGVAIMKKTGSVLLSGTVVLIVGYLLITVGAIQTGGIHSKGLYSFGVSIMFAFLLTGFRSGIVWIAILAVTLAVLQMMSAGGYDFGEVAGMDRSLTSVVTLLISATIASVLFEFTNKSNAQKFEKERDLSIKAAEEQKKLLDNASEVMNAVAGGDLTQEITTEIEGDLGQLKDSVNRALAMLSGTLQKVVEDTSRILTASLELSNASQSMAEGTGDQAASLEEISSSISEIDGMAKNNEGSASQAQQLSNQAMSEISSSSEQMEAMLVSMQHINTTSSDVSKVIKVIDEIAFQTNLLALNAAVEAARAGKYGKGFAVVAEEVRNLASRSAEAAKNTTSLIESSIAEVDKGVKNADRTAEIIKGFVSSIEKVNDLVGEISAASKEQSVGVGEISRGLTQVNEVVQNNSSISEETASSSEELRQQAQTLQEMMNRFRLRGQTQVQRPPVPNTPVRPVVRSQPQQSRQKIQPRLIQEPLITPAPSAKPAPTAAQPKPSVTPETLITPSAPTKPAPEAAQPKPSAREVEVTDEQSIPAVTPVTENKRATRPNQIVLDDDEFGKY